MTLQEAWEQLHKPYNRFDKDLIALRVIIEEDERRLKDLEKKLSCILPEIPFLNSSSNIQVKKRGRPRKEVVHAESDGTSPETSSS